MTAENLVRRCAVVRASDLTINQLQKAIQDGLSAVLILLPRDLQEITGDSLEVRKVMMFMCFAVFSEGPLLIFCAAARTTGSECNSDDDRDKD